MKLAMYQGKSGFPFCVMTRVDDAADVQHIERTMNCKFVRWQE